MSNIVKRLGAGWYNFALLDQSNKYIKVAQMCSGTDEKAKEQARRILGDKTAQVTIEV